MSKEINRESFIFYRSFYEAAKELSYEEQGQLYSAILEYGLNGKEVKLAGVVKAMFILIKPQLEANNQRFENGCRGGRPKGTETEPKPNQTETKKETEPKPKGNQKESKSEPNDNDNVNVNVNDNVNVNVNDNVNVNENDVLAEKFGEFKNVLLTAEELKKLKNNFSDWEKKIEILSGYMQSKGKKYKSHYATILNWARNDESKQNESNKAESHYGNYSIL